MTDEQLFDGLAVLGKFIVRGLAVIGFMTLIIAFGYSMKKAEPSIKSARCINSSCEPNQKCSPRFQRHMGECEK